MIDFSVERCHCWSMVNVHHSFKETQMKRMTVFMVMAIVAAFNAVANELPTVFLKAPMIDLPISVGKTGRARVFITSDDSKSANEESLKAMQYLHEHLMADSKVDLFSMGNDEWSQVKKMNLTSNNSWDISRLPCIEGLKCFLLAPDGGVWLVIFKGDKITDFQLVEAIQSNYDEKGNYIGRIASLDTTFGDGAIFQQLPITNFEQTGIFCSSIVYGQTTSVHFKRRITPEGKIENKQIEGGYTQCKAPW